MKQSFVIPGRLSGLNEYVNAAHSPWKRTKLKEQNEAIVTAAAELAHIQPVEGQSCVTMTFYERPEKGQRARDLDNVTGGGAKFILDALQTMGVIERDDCKHIPELHKHGYFAGEGRQRIVVEIETLGD